MEQRSPGFRSRGCPYNIIGHMILILIESEIMELVIVDDT